MTPASGGESTGAYSCPTKSRVSSPPPGAMPTYVPESSPPTPPVSRPGSTIQKRVPFFSAWFIDASMEMRTTTWPRFWSMTIFCTVPTFAPRKRTGL